MAPFFDRTIRISIGLFVLLLMGCSRDSGVTNQYFAAPESTSTAELPIDSHGLVQAVKNGDLEQVKRIVQGGADVNSTVKGKNGEISPLLAATYRGNVDIIHFLLLAKANPHFRYQGFTVRDYAELNGNEAVLREFRVYDQPVVPRETVYE